MRLQTQLDLNKPNFTKFPNYRENIWAVEAFLGPRDVLYLPPYWFHKVITEEPGIGLNIWSSSRGMLVEEQAKSIPNPIWQCTTWPKRKTALALKTFSQLLIQHVFPKHLEQARSPVQFLSEMIALQFSPIFDDCSALPALDCNFSETEVLHFQAAMGSSMGSSLLQLGKLFRSLPDESIRELEVFTYIEKLANSCLGPNYLLPFFKSCFSPTQLGNEK